MPKLDLFVVGFGRPDLLREQKRLLDKYLEDDHELICVDNTPDPGVQQRMVTTCINLGIQYHRAPARKHEHNEALNYAASRVTHGEYFGFIDHDVFPREKCTLIDKIQDAGFFGVGQRHSPTGRLYLWPGFCFFSKTWLGERLLNFDGIRDLDPRNNGDCGSMNWPLFVGEDWGKLFPLEHGYRNIRPPDDYGLQSFGYEIIGPFIHLTNASHWMDVPNYHERDALLLDLVSQL